MARLDGERGAADRGRRQQIGGPPLVGRTAEICRLMQAFRGAARERDTRVALITGPPGMGKTRLAAELAAHTRRVGARVGIGRSWGDGGAPPLRPWRAVLGDLGDPKELLADGLGQTVRDRFARFVAVLR